MTVRFPSFEFAAQAPDMFRGAQQILGGLQSLANIPLTEVKTATMPYTALGQYYGGLGRYQTSNYYNRPNYQLVKSLSSPEMQSLVASNPQVAKMVAQALSQVAQQAQQPQQSSQQNINAPTISPDDIFAKALTGQKTIPQSQYGQLAQAVNKISPGAAQFQQNIPQTQVQAEQTTPQQPDNQPTALNENDMQQLSQNMQDVLSRKTRTAQQLNQAQYAGVLKNLFNSATSIIPSVAKYAGVTGKGLRNLDAVKSSLGETSPDYANYLYFTRTLAPTIANEMRRTLGGQATDYEGKMMSGLSNPTYWDSNPEQAVRQWRQLASMYQNQVDPALARRPSATLASLSGNDVRENANQGINSKNDKPDNLQRIRVISKDGKSGTIPSSQLEEAIKQGFRRE